MTASMVRAREAMSRPRAENESEVSTQRKASCKSEPRKGTPKTSRAKPRKTTTSMTSRRRRERRNEREVLPARHGRGDEALEEFFLARFDNGESEAPDGGAHQVHAQQAGNDEVDVAGAGFVDEIVLRRDRIVAAGRDLDGAVGEQAGGARVGIGVVVVVDARRPASEWRAAESSPVASAWVPAASSMLEARRPWSAASACVSCGVVAATGSTSGGPVAEGDAEADGEQDGKNEDPEEGFGLAQEQPEARGGELVESC